MIFRSELVAKIRTGEKTQTRRPVKEGQPECRYRPGRSYAVQNGRGKKASCRIAITDVRQELLHEIGAEDAQAEGFPDQEAFFAYWRDMHGTGPLLRIPVWVISFVLDARAPERFLARRVGYVEQGGGAIEPPMGAMELEQGGEPAAVDEETQARFTAEGWERHARRNPTPELEKRLKVVREEARQKGIAAHRMEASIERRIAAYERLVRAEAA